MNERIRIEYNGIDAFTPQPTPLIVLDESNVYYGELWAKQEIMTLQGQLTGCSYEAIVAAENDLINRFNKSYQTLSVWQEGPGYTGKVYEKQLSEIQSIRFGESRMFGVQDYSITLSCYPSGYFSGAFGILDPQDSWNFTEQQDATLVATHNIACRAFTTSSGPSNALVNARDWAFGRSGMNSMPAPIFISGVTPQDFCLVTQSENIDRFNGNYSLTEVYSNDLARSGYGIIRYSANIESGNDIITVSLNGVAQGCQRNMTELRAAFNNLDKTAIATRSYEQTFQRNDLNPIPITQSFEENAFDTTINFSYVYNNDNSPSIVFDYNVDLSVGVNGFITASIQGTIRAREGDVLQRLSACQQYATTINLYNLCLPYYNGFDASSIIPLNPIAVTSGQSINHSNGTVGLNATFTNQNKYSAVLDRFDFSMEFQPQVTKVDQQPKLNGLGSYSVVSLNYANRASLSINGNALVGSSYSSSAGIDAVKEIVFSLFQQYGRMNAVTLDRNTITTDRTDEKLLSFSYSWSFNSPNTIGPESIPTLSV